MWTSYLGPIKAFFHPHVTLWSQLVTGDKMVDRLGKFRKLCFVGFIFALTRLILSLKYKSWIIVPSFDSEFVV